MQPTLLSHAHLNTEYYSNYWKNKQIETVMDYNNYYLPQVGQPLPTVTNQQHGGPQMHQQHPPSGLVMHAPMPPQNVRHAISPGQTSHLQQMQQQQQHLHQHQYQHQHLHQHHHHHQQQQHQQQHQQQQQQQHQQQQHQQQQQQHQQHQHLGHLSRQMSPQQQQHPNYHQIQSPHPHGPPLSHSVSPHPQQQSHHSHQPAITGPSPQQSPQHRIHQQSPHHHTVSPMHMQQQQQQLNQIARTPMGPSIMNQHQPALQQSPHHHQSLSSGDPIPQPHLHHYPQQNQNQHQTHHQSQIHHQHQNNPSMTHHAPPTTSRRPHSQQGIGRSSPYYPNILQTEFRIIELNRRLQCRPNSRHSTSPLPDSPNDEIWWRDFASEFFDDDATLTLRVPDDRPVEYSVGRTLIPRFFRTYFDGGVTDLSINLRNPKEACVHPQVITLNCDQAFIITNNIFKHPAMSSGHAVVVCTEGHLSLEFFANGQESLLIKAWRFDIRHCREYIDRSITSIGLPSKLLVEPTTHIGLPHSTMVYLRMCAILEPMQELMTQQKFSSLEPRACLKKILVEKFKFKAEDDNKKQNGRRKRKTIPVPNDDETPLPNKRTKASSAKLCNTDTVSSSVTANLPTLDVMIVGEPSCMANNYHDDNERSIVEVENSNYQPHNEPSGEHETSGDQIEEKNEQPKIEDGQEESERDNVVPDDREEDSNINQDQAIEQTWQDALETESKDVDQPKIDTSDEKNESLPEEPSRQISEEPIEKENNSTLALNDDTHTSSTATQSENHYNIMNSIPEDRADTCRSTSCDSIVSKLPPSSNNRSALTSNGSSNKQNRRRSSERKETLREGLMRTSDFVVAMKDLKCEHPSLWRITTGNNLLQQFEPKTQNGAILYENTNQYAGWNPEIKKDYVGVDVKLTQHTRNQITVERLLLNFQNIEDADAFYDKHFVIYLQVLISTALDPKFWESIESEPKHHDYFLTSHRIIEDITKRFKTKLANKLKLSETTLKNVEKYPNLLIKPVEKDEREQVCRACNTNSSTQVVSFGNRSYDLHSYKPVKVTSELSKTDDKDLRNNLCVSCLELVKLYSEVHHMGYKLFNLAREKVELHRTKGKPINAVLDECLKDEDWLATIYAERDSLWSKVEHIQ